MTLSINILKLVQNLIGKNILIYIFVHNKLHAGDEKNSNAWETQR